MLILAKSRRIITDVCMEDEEDEEQEEEGHDLINAAHSLSLTPVNSFPFPHRSHGWVCFGAGLRRSPHPGSAETGGR